MSSLHCQTWRGSPAASSRSTLRRKRSRNRLVVQALEECEDRILMAVVSLGAAQTFAVLGATTVTNTGLTTIVGDLGVSPGTAVTGFPPGIVTGGTIHSNDPIATQAEADAATAYGVLAGETPTTDLTGQDLGGLTLAPGVYHFATSAALSGILTLDAQGNPNARFDFQIGTTLTTAIGSAVHLINGAQANNVFFQVGSSATLGVDTAFEGNILALTSITLTTGASMLDGRALALNGAVTLDTNSLAAPVNPPPVLATINPASTPENQGSIVLTVTGTNFIPSSIVQFNGVPLVTTYVSGTQLQAIVPAGDVGEEGVAAITVANPPPGGGTSDPAQLTITDPSVIATGGFTLAVAFGTPTGLQTVATFTDPGGAEPNPNDPDPPDLNGHYAATINWGDGSPNTPGTITFNAVTQVFTVSGDHTYTTGSGAFPITVTIDHEASAPVTVVSTADVSDAPITADPVPVFGTEGAPLTNVDVATFTDPDPSSRAGDFVTTVNWGDGTTTAGTVVEDAAGTFHVQGSHTYTEESAIPIPITVLIIDVAGGRAVDDPTNSTATVVSPATIRQSPLLPVASAVVATEGAPLAAGTPLASFTDTGGADPVSDYTATVNWGDGGPTTAATVSLLGNGGNFAVTSATPHIYAEEGIYAVTVTITDADPTNLNGVPTSAMTTTTATVADAPLTAIASPPFPPAVEGSALTAQVASFTDANLLASITDFTATIDWGDGTPITTGTVTGGGDGAPFIVSGGHTYAEAGTYTIHTTVNDDGGQQASMTLAAVVSDAPLSGGTAIAIAGNEGQLLNNIPVAVFVDANPDATPADIIATIDWGDGSPSTPGVVTKIGSTGTGASIFQVSGTHTYVTSVGLAATATVSIADEDTFAINGGVPQIILNPALTIAPGAIDVIALPLVATVGVSTPPLFVVATFTDTTGADATSSYSATLDWGDSTSNDTTNGLVIVPLGGDQFEIEAPAHTYAASGIYPLTVTVDDTDPASGIGRNIAFVQPVVTVSPLAISTAPVTATEGLALPNAQTIDLSTGPAATLVATFTDSAGLDAASDYSVVIDWGNGQTTSGTILPDGPDFAIIAPATPSIIYAEEGHYTIQIAVTDHVDGFTAFAATSATVDDAALAPSAPQPTIPTVTQGIPTGQIPIASFHDANPSAPVSDFTATIDWGDGSPQSAGIVSQPGGIGTAFLVSGNHLYIHPSTGAGDTVTVHIVDDGGATLNVLITVPVVASTIVGTPATFNAVEGLPVSNVIVATFTDSGLAGPLSSYQATIGWNDGTPGTTTIGQVVPLGGNDFEVIGNLPTGYPEEGNFTVTVTLSHNGSTVDVIGNSIAKVADAPLSTAGPAIAVAATEGVAIPAGTTVAIFTDADPAGTTSDYTATINWGDGTPTETLPPSAITQPGGPGSAFIVQAGGHIYVEEGLDSFTVTITDHNASTTVAGQATVADSPPIASPTQPAVNTTEGQVFSGPAASFTELYTNGIQTNPEAASDYTATIDWGDGSPNSVGIVVATATPGFYQVLGTHVYAQSGVNIGGNPSVPVGTFPITVTVHDDGGTNVVIPNLAHVSDVPIVVTGQLNPSSDTGKFNNDGITDDSTPNFFGTSEAGSSVSLFATPVGGGTSILIGQAVADANGNWSVTSIHLADGSYTIAATAIDSAHQTTTASTVPIAVVSNGGANVLTIDTVGPRVTDVSFNRATGTVSLTFADDRSGLLLQSLIDSANYAFNRQLARPLGTFIITTINLTPGPNANEETATLSIASTSKGQTLSSALLRGFFLITARSKSVLNPSAIQDVAGNALDGEYYGPASASGNGIPGGDFVANLNNYHNITNPPATVIGFPHPNDPAGHFGKQQRTKPVPKPVVKHVPTHVPKSVPKVHKHR